MSKISSGFMLFSLLMALSLGVVFGEETAAEDVNASENASLNATGNITINATGNATINATGNITINATENVTINMNETVVA